MTATFASIVFQVNTQAKVAKRKINSQQMSDLKIWQAFPLFGSATLVVIGEVAEYADLIIGGEQPGDQ